MQYVIKDKEGVEHGPVDETTLVKWATEKRIDSQTPIRSTLVNNWRVAAEMDFLKAHVLDPVVEKSSGGGMFSAVSDLLSVGKLQANSPQGFLQRRVAVKAKLSTRFMAFLYDAVIFFVIGILLLGYLIGNVINTSSATMPDTDIAQADCLIDKAEYGKRKMQIRKAEEYAEYLKVLQKQIEKEAKEKEKEERDNEDRGEYAPKPKSKLPPPSSPENRPREMGRQAGFGEMSTGGSGPVMVKKEEENEEEKPPEEAYMPDLEVVDNDKATGAPTKKADFKAGYFRGATWTVANSGEKYVCLSNEEENALWCNVGDLRKEITKGVLVVAILALIYYTLAIGLYAQTFGMWFWGLFVARPGREPREAFFFRAFLFALFMLLFGVLTPFFVFISGCGLHDLLAGVRVYHVAGKAAS
jgi:uncharacterized RDD family membrane protein YckC